MKGFKQFYSSLIKSNDVCGAFVKLRQNLPIIQKKVGEILENAESVEEKREISYEIEEHVRRSLCSQVLCASNYGDTRFYTTEIDILSKCVVHPKKVLPLEYICVLYATERYRIDGIGQTEEEFFKNFGGKT